MRLPLTQMNTNRFLIWTAAVQVGVCMIVFLAFPNFSRRLLARILAASFMLEDLRNTYVLHFRRIMTVPEIHVPSPRSAPGMEIVPLGFSRIAEDVVAALVNQSVSKKTARETVLHLQKDGLQSFEELFRNATAILRSKKNGRLS